LELMQSELEKLENEYNKLLTVKNSLESDLKAMRKDAVKQSTQLRKEIDRLNLIHSKETAMDQKSQNRIINLSESIKERDEMTANLETELENLKTSIDSVEEEISVTDFHIQSMKDYMYNLEKSSDTHEALFKPPLKLQMEISEWLSKIADIEAELASVHEQIQKAQSEKLKAERSVFSAFLTQRSRGSGMGASSPSEREVRINAKIERLNELSKGYI
jgi:chromosome segregation ATPase